MAEAVQAATGETVLAFAKQGYTGETAAQQADTHRIKLEVVKLKEAKRGFVLLPRRCVVARSIRMGGAFPPLGERL